MTSTKRLTGKLADPEFRRERARKASAAAHSPSTLIRQIGARVDQLTPEDGALLCAIGAIAGGAPELSAQQIDVLRPILSKAVPGSRADAA